MMISAFLLHGVLCFSWSFIEGRDFLRVNKSLAETQCEKYGGLLSYEMFMEENISTTLESYGHLLTEGDSGWISGFVTYSKFVAMYGCALYIDNNDYYSFTTSKPSIYVCLQLFNKIKDFQYLGIYNDTCHCFSFSSWYIGYMYRLMNCEGFENSSNIFESTYGFLKSPNRDKYLIFRVYENDEIFGKQNSSCIYGQCAFLETNAHDKYLMTIKYGTQSCYIDGNAIDGYVCTDKEFYRYHIFIETSVSSWVQARDKCRELGLSLAGKIDRSELPRFPNTKRLWTGLFRDFEISSETSSSTEEHVCLSVRRIGNGFVFDPGECSEPKVALCEIIPSTEALFRDILSTEKEYADSHETNNTPSAESYDSVQRFFVILTLNCVILATVICNSIIIYKTNKSQLNTKQTQSIEDSTQTENSVKSVSNKMSAHSMTAATETGQTEPHYYSTPNPMESADRLYDMVCISGTLM